MLLPPPPMEGVHRRGWRALEVWGRRSVHSSAIHSSVAHMAGSEPRTTRLQPCVSSFKSTCTAWELTQHGCSCPGKKINLYAAAPQTIFPPCFFSLILLLLLRQINCHNFCKHKRINGTCRVTQIFMVNVPIRSLGKNCFLKTFRDLTCDSNINRLNVWSSRKNAHCFLKNL